MADQKTHIIYVYLPDELVDVWRPVEAQCIRDSIFRIVSVNPDPQNERWEFSTGTVVLCEQRPMDDGKEVLVAIKEIRE